MSKKLYDIPRGSQGFDNFNQSLGTISIVQMFVLGILSIASRFDTIMTKLNFKSSQKLKPEISRIINDMKKMETRRELTT
ncbi:hypothetical protein BLOT_006216 [Blomia tropicalis]|nr:hypothetical protein BLOT_006216 [Blomia tropicalis]